MFWSFFCTFLSADGLFFTVSLHFYITPSLLKLAYFVRHRVHLCVFYFLLLLLHFQIFFFYAQIALILSYQYRTKMVALFLPFHLCPFVLLNIQLFSHFIFGCWCSCNHYVVPFFVALISSSFFLSLSHFFFGMCAREGIFSMSLF